MVRTLRVIVVALNCLGLVVVVAGVRAEENGSTGSRVQRLHTRVLPSRAVAPELIVVPDQQALAAPLAIEDVTIAGNPYQLGDHIEGDNWLQPISFNVKNTGTKPIVYAYVEVSFKQARETGGEISFHVTLGPAPGTAVSDQKPFLIAPGTSVAARFSIKHEEEKAGQQPFEIHRLNMRVLHVVFADGSEWSVATAAHKDTLKP